MYRSYSVNNMPQPVVEPEQKPLPPPIKETVKKEQKKEELFPLAGLKLDDLILLIVIALLIFNECNDKLLLLALIYIFFSDYFKK